MLAVDTNVIVRYLTRDDAAQFARADRLIATNDIYMCTTVLLEAEWVLRDAYGYQRPEIAEALGELAGLPTVTLEDPAHVAQALEWIGRGMDFANALHLAASGECEAFISFDRRLATRARGIADVVVRRP